MQVSREREADRVSLVGWYVKQNACNLVVVQNREAPPHVLFHVPHRRRRKNDFIEGEV